jgi:integrase
VRKQQQLTLRAKSLPTEIAVRRKLEALLLQLNSGTPASQLQDPTLGAVIEVYAREEMPERPKSRQHYASRKCRTL